MVTITLGDRSYEVLNVKPYYGDGGASFNNGHVELHTITGINLSLRKFGDIQSIYTTLTWNRNDIIYNGKAYNFIIPGHAETLYRIIQTDLALDRLE